MKNILCKRLIIHGKADRLVNHNHSERLAKINPDLTWLELVDDMSHTQFSFYHDLCVHIIDFLNCLK